MNDQMWCIVYSTFALYSVILQESAFRRRVFMSSHLCLCEMAKQFPVRKRAFFFHFWRLMKPFLWQKEFVPIVFSICFQINEYLW